MPPSDGERLQKILAGVGLGSRRTCEELIDAGRVTVNGRVATLGDKADVEIGIGLQAQENADNLRRVGPHFHQTMNAGGPHGRGRIFRGGA